MQFCSRFLGLLILVSLCTGCASQHPPLRAIGATERLGARVIEGRLADSSPRAEYSTTESQALKSTGAQSGLAPAVVMETSAAVMDYSGSRWADGIRAKGGISEGAVLTDAVRARVEELNRGQANRGDSGAVVT